MQLKFILAVTAIALQSFNVHAQESIFIPKPIKELKLSLNASGTNYIKATLLNQTWVRWTELNPGSTVNQIAKDQVTDIGLRRTRFQLYGQLSDHVFFYTQYGFNNFNYLSQNAGNRKLQAFFHDALGEYKVFKDNEKLKIGGGLSIISGLSRFSQPSISSIVSYDVPVFLQTTVDQIDEFARKFSVYARGQVGKVDYRLAISDPFPIQTNGQTMPAIGKNATFTPIGHNKEYGGLFIYNFFENEPNTTPYMAGTYLGDKKIWNVETGFIYNKNATYYLNNNDTTYNDMLHVSIGSFLDLPVKHKYLLNAYAGYFYTDYGHNYLRMNGIMNMANGLNSNASYNGIGNAYPMFGTGQNIYTQLAWRCAADMLGKNGTLMPFVSYRWSKYNALKDAVSVTEGGINWLMSKQNSKLTLAYQMRPIFEDKGTNEIVKTKNASTGILQYQVFF